MTLQVVTLMGDLNDGSLSPVSGTLTFAPSGWLTDTTATVIPPSPITIPLSASGTFSVTLLATDNDEPAPGTWLWNVRIAVTGTPVRLFAFELLHASGAEQDFAAIIPIPPADVTATYAAGGDLSGTYPDPTVAKVNGVAVTGTPSAGQVPTATSGTAASWQDLPAPELPSSTLGDLLYEDATPALARLAGNTTTSKKFLTQTGTGSASAAPAWGSIAAADVPTLNQNTTGTAANVSGVVGVAHGGTGASSQNFAPLLTMTPVKTSGYSAQPGDYVRADATSASLTVTLPAAPADLTAVAVKMTGTSGTNTVTVSRSGSDVFNVSGGATSLTLTALNQAVICQYNAAGAIWLVTTDSVSLAQLDQRYLASNGVAVTGTPSPGMILTASSTSAASWQSPASGAGVTLDTTATDIQALGTRAAGSTGKAADAGHVHPTTGLPVLDTTAGDIAALGSQAAGSTGKAADAGHVHPTTGVALLAGAAFAGAVSSAKAVTAGVVALTDAATIAIDASLGNTFRVTLGGNRTLGAPSNPTDGQKILLEVIQDGTGSRTLAYNAVYAFSTDIPSPTLTTTAGKRDLLGFCYSASASKWLLAGIVHAF